MGCQLQRVFTRLLPPPTRTRCVCVCAREVYERVCVRSGPATDLSCVLNISTVLCFTVHPHGKLRKDLGQRGCDTGRIMAIVRASQFSRCGPFYRSIFCMCREPTRWTSAEMRPGSQMFAVTGCCLISQGIDTGPRTFLLHSTTSHSPALLWPSPNHLCSRNKHICNHFLQLSK